MSHFRLIVGVPVSFLVLTGSMWTEPFERELPVDAPIVFEDDLESAYIAARQSGRQIVVVFAAVW